MTAQEDTLTAPGHPKVPASVDHLGRKEAGVLFDPACPTRQLLDRVGSKWTAMVILVLARHAPLEVRFADPKRQIPGVSQKMLAHTLRSLERDSIVDRRVEATSPPRVHYSLTSLGLSLQTTLDAVRRWAEANMRQVDDANRAWDDQHI